MSWKSFAIRAVLALAFAAWSVQVLAVAVFAVGDRYTGIEAVIMSLIVLAGGFAPVAFLAYLFRDSLPALLTVRSREAGAGTVTLSGRPPEPEPPVSAPPIEALSDRELEVLALVARGQTNKEIASELSVTVGTVKTHTNNINRKLGTRTRIQAVARAREHGLL